MEMALMLKIECPLSIANEIWYYCVPR